MFNFTQSISFYFHQISPVITNEDHYSMSRDDYSNKQRSNSFKNRNKTTEHIEDEEKDVVKYNKVLQINEIGKYNKEIDRVLFVYEPLFVRYPLKKGNGSYGGKAGDIFKKYLEKKAKMTQQGNGRITFG
ncbi:hypothetical protein CDIK_1101 [Cucumispora dikerogammari]|nr:hypothetical protein CDIK_1101 [Cucumispora dikerogammari]